MDYNVALEAGTGKVSEKRSNSQLTADYNKDGLTNLSRGQQITGTVLTVDDQVTIDFDGQKVTASKEVLPNAVPGEKRTFEVVKATPAEIELRLADGTGRELRSIIKAVVIKDMDWEKVLEKKEQGIRQSEKEKAVRETLGKLKEISTKFTEADSGQLEREGFPAETLTVSGLYEAINRVKSESAGGKKTGMDQSGREQDGKALTKDKQAERLRSDGQQVHNQAGGAGQIDGRQGRTQLSDAERSAVGNADGIKAADIAVRLKEENLPDTAQNIDRISKALVLSDTAAKLDDKAMKYLIASETVPTIENIYKAYYSSGAGNQKQELTGHEWSQLEAQVKTVIEDAGYEVNQENLAEARWLIENRLPLLPRTFAYKKELKDIREQTDRYTALDRIVEGMKGGTAPKDVNLGVRENPALQRIVEDVNTISEEAVTCAVREKQELTIKKLTAIQSDLSAGRIRREDLTGPKAIVPEAVEKDIAAKEAGAKNAAVKDTTKDTTAKDTTVKDITAKDAIVKEITSKGAIVTEITAQDAVVKNMNPSDAVSFPSHTGRSEAEDSGAGGMRGVILEAADSDGRKQKAENLHTDKENPIPSGSVREEAIRSEDLTENSGSDPDEKQQNSSSRQEYEILRAQRQLEEIRLRMTLEAAQRLEKKGISVETERLEKVVEELRRLEDSYYQRLLKEAETESTPEAVEILKNTVQSMERLRYVPAAVLGSTLTGRTGQTVPGLLSEGARLQAIFEKAGTAYETLMTVPNPEYGDSIHKAFARVDSLLSELNIEDTRANQRAARILGYNRMEITQETVEQVKAYDMEVNTLIRNLHPAVTVRMIKEGMDPLQMPVSELNDVIERMKEEQGITSEDKFSTYLHRLEKENGITPQERNAYIGVYRLLYNLDKSDGAALGAVVKADQEVTLANLLTAVQTGRKGSVNAAVDDGFGMLTELTRSKESIAQQLEGMKAAERGEISSPEQEAESTEKQQYLNRVLKQITEEVSPEKLLKLQQGTQMQDGGQHMAEGGTSSAASQPTEGSRLWETLRDISVEKLLEQLQGTDDDGTDTAQLHAQKVQQIRELNRNAEQSLRFLNDYRMESTPQNIMMANQLLSNGLTPTLRQLKKQSENSDENLEQGLKELSELSDTLIDKSSMNEAFEKLEAQAKTRLEQACSDGVINSGRLAELRMIGQQAAFLRGLASREFYRIPIETAKGVTNMNLTVLRGSQTAGRVSATVWSEELGDIKAEFSLKDRTLKGFVTCSSRDGLGRLQANTAELMQAAKESNVSLRQLDFSLRGWENDNYSYQNPEFREQSTLPGNETERILYRLAKAFVQTVGLAEKS